MIRQFDVSPLVLVVDPHPETQDILRDFFAELQLRVVAATTLVEGLEAMARGRPDLIVLDLHLPDQPGLEAFDQLHQVDVDLPIILTTPQAGANTAIEAMKRGAFDYLAKPLRGPQLRQVIASALRTRGLTRDFLHGGEHSHDRDGEELLGSSEALQEVYKAIGRVAPHDITVLIMGESGTGKEMVARAIYQHSRRNDRPFLAINCAAIPEALLESELFGHEKGAFTGADRQRLGKFEQCNGGTILLDEIGDMAPLTQAKILRVLQEQKFERVGGNQTISTNVRVIAATHRPLDRLVAEGQFRSDLFYRLSVFTISLPPLRKHLDDLPLLVNHFLRRFSLELGKEVCRASPEALDLLRRHSWPGNVRELQSVLKQALLRTNGPILVPEFLPRFSESEATPPAPGPVSSLGLDQFIQQRIDDGCIDLYAQVQRLADEKLLTQVLRYTRGNQLRAARLLGITRGKLRVKLRALGLTTDRAAWSAAATADGPLRDSQMQSVRA